MSYGYQKSVGVLAEHVIREQINEKGGRRFLIRALKFGDTGAKSIGFSRQWLTPDGVWAADKKGHAYFPPDVWNELVACIPEINKVIQTALENDNCGGRMGPYAQRPYGGGSYAPNATTITAGGDSADGSTANATADGGETASLFAPPPAKTSPTNNIFGEGDNFKRRGTAFSNGSPSVYRRGAAKRGYGQ
jgi:hypothetical protein